MSAKESGPKLTLEEKDLLHDLVHTGQVIVILKLMQHFSYQREQDLLTFTYKPGEEQDLMHRKSKQMGAKEFFNSFKRYLETIKGRKLL